MWKLCPHRGQLSLRSGGIGLSGVFSLARWSWQIQTGFHVSRLTQDTTYIINNYMYGIIPNSLNKHKLNPSINTTFNLITNKSLNLKSTPNNYTPYSNSTSLHFPYQLNSPLKINH